MNNDSMSKMYPNRLMKLLRKAEIIWYESLRITANFMSLFNSRKSKSFI